MRGIAGFTLHIIKAKPHVPRMAKTARRKGARGIWRRPYVSLTLALGALASKDVVLGTLSNAVDEKVRWTSIDANYSLGDTITAGEGPVAFGVSHPDYTAAEVEEAIEAFGAVTLADKVANEKANRLVRLIGILSAAEPTFREGQIVKTRLNWMLATAEQPAFWAYNLSANVLTTGMNVNVAGWLNLKY